MLPGGNRTICIISQTFPGVDLYSIDTDRDQHLTTADTGSTVDDLHDLYVDDLDYLDRDLSEMCIVSTLLSLASRVD